MKEFKIGGKLKLTENEEYIIVDIIEYNNEIYYFASSVKKPITPKVFQRIDEDGKTYINFVEDKEIIKYIAKKVANEE